MGFVYEMLEIVKKLLILVGLSYFAWWDYKFKTVALIPIWVFGVGGILWNLFTGENAVWNMVGSMFIGCILLIISFLTAESVGMGDGLLFMVSGCYLSFVQNMALLMGTIFLLGGFAVICLALKKRTQKDRVVMAPFMLTAYVMFIL